MVDRIESGTTEHPHRVRLEAFARGELTGEELLETGDHIAGCEECAASIAVPDMRFARLDGESEERHLSEDEIRSVAEGRAEAPVHLDACELCSTAVEDLVTLRNDLQEMDASPAADSAMTAPPTPSIIKWLLVPAFGLAAIAAVLFWINWRNPVPYTANLEVREPELGGEIPATPLNEQNEQPEASPGPNPIELADGGRVIAIDESGRVIGVDSPEWARKAKLALERGQFSVDGSAKELEGASGALMSGDEPGVPFRLRTPVGSYIESQRPTFRWEAVEGAESYRVEVYDRNFDRVATGKNISGTAWTPVQPLARGGIYSWQVIAQQGDEEVRSPVRPAPDAQFKVIGADAARSLSEARLSGSSLLLGIAYAEAGMLSEAESQLAKLRKQNPKSREVAALLRKLRSVR